MATPLRYVASCNMKSALIAILATGGLAASMAAQTATITSEWETIIRVNGAQQTNSFPLNSTYGVGTNETQSFGGPGSSVSSQLRLQPNSVRIATSSSVNLLSGPGPTIDLISRGEILVMIPAGRGRLHMEGRSHASGGPGGSGRVRVDVFDDGSIDFAPPPTFQSPLLEFDILIDSATDTPVSVDISSSLTGSTLLDEAFANVEMTWIPHNKVVLPDTHYLMERPEQTGSTGSAAWWRGTASRFQIVYEARHFLDHGVSGPIMIEGLCFRGEDGEPSNGGHSWAGAQVRVGATSLDGATLGTTFANNTAASSTTMGPLGTIDIVEGPSSGSTPNDFNIVIDLGTAGANFSFDPTGSRPNLLIDIVLPNGTAMGNTMMTMQDTTGNATEIGGAGIFALNSGTATGNPSQPLVVGVQFDGAGGYEQIIPARNELYGAGCGGSPSSFYQSFLPGQPFEITGLTLTPDTYPSPNTYTVSGGAAAVDASQINASADTQSDDGVVAHSLGFSFEFPGGATSTIGACTNGYLWLGNSTVAAFRPVVAELLDANTPRLAPCWYDFHAGRNASTLPQSGLHVKTVGSAPNRITYVTWLDVGVFTAGAADAAVHRMQCVLHEATGVIEYRYGNMPTYCANSSGAANPAVVGFSRGEIAGIPSVDPQSRDLSHEVPFATKLEGNRSNMGLRSVATPIAGGATYGGRMFAGQTITWDANNVPPGAVIGAFILDFVPSVPGLSLPGIHAPGCIESTTIQPLIWEVVLFPGATVSGAVPVNIDPGYIPDDISVEIYAQFVLLDLFGGPSIVTASSNAIKHTLGLR